MFDTDTTYLNPLYQKGKAIFQAQFMTVLSDLDRFPFLKLRNGFFLIQEPLIFRT